MPLKGLVMDWPTAAVIIAIAFAIMVIVSTYLTVRKP